MGQRCWGRENGAEHRCVSRAAAPWEGQGPQGGLKTRLDHSHPFLGTPPSFPKEPTVQVLSPVLGGSSSVESRSSGMF